MAQGNLGHFFMLPGEKCSKLSVHYRERPKGAERCGYCTMFRKPHKCTAVQGHIESFGWCKLFKRKD